MCGIWYGRVKPFDKVYPIGYIIRAWSFGKTEVFSKWIDGLRDLGARARIQARIERLAGGNPGDFKSIGEGVAELRIDHGPGYRVYYKKQGREFIILLAGETRPANPKTLGRPWSWLETYRGQYEENRYHPI